MRVRWLRRALANLDDVGEYIGRDNPAAAAATVQRIMAAVDAMAAGGSANAGRPGRVAGTRELVVTPNYLVPYRVRGDVLEVLRVMHARQRWPAGLP